MSIINAEAKQPIIEVNDVIIDLVNHGMPLWSILHIYDKPNYLQMVYDFFKLGISGEDIQVTPIGEVEDWALNPNYEISISINF